MRKVFSLMLLLATLLTVSSCSKDEDKDKPTVNDIVGTWELSQASFDGKDYVAWPFEKTTATFKSDGTYSGSGYFGTGSGTWKQSGKTITTYVDGEEYARYEVESLSASTCTLKMTYDGDAIWVKCIKK